MKKGYEGERWYTRFTDYVLRCSRIHFWRDESRIVRGSIIEGSIPSNVCIAHDNEVMMSNLMRRNDQEV